jgi:hypothetical protein
VIGLKFASHAGYLSKFDRLSMTCWNPPVSLACVLASLPAAALLSRRKFKRGRSLLLPPEGCPVTMKIANCAALVLAASCFNGGDAYTVSRSTLRNLAAPKSIAATPSGAAGRTGNMKMEGP